MTMRVALCEKSGGAMKMEYTDTELRGREDTGEENWQWKLSLLLRR